MTSDKKKSPVSFWTISSDKQSHLAVDPTRREVGALLSVKKKKRKKNTSPLENAVYKQLLS